MTYSISTRNLHSLLISSTLLLAAIPAPVAELIVFSSTVLFTVPVVDANYAETTSILLFFCSDKNDLSACLAS